VNEMTEFYRGNFGARNKKKVFDVNEKTEEDLIEEFTQKNFHALADEYIRRDLRMIVDMLGNDLAIKDYIEEHLDFFKEFCREEFINNKEVKK
jgi:hypothetical protein